MKRLLFAVSFVLLSAGGAIAQGCSVCTKTAGELGEKSAEGLNNGIIYLALLPLAIIGTIAFIWWKHYRQ